MSRRIFVLVSAFIAAGATLSAWPGDHPHEPLPKPVNLQVLPQDIAPKSLGALMKGYEKDLGVRCSYCHVQNPDTGKIDYASDENPKKHTARVMIGMLADINDRHLAQLGDRRYAVPVTCGSCHLGQSNPPAFEASAR